MPKRSRQGLDLGFDIEAAREALVAKLVESQAVTAATVEKLRAKWRCPIDIEAQRSAMLERGDPSDQVERLVSDWQSLVDRRAAASASEVDWAITLEIAQTHAQCHGVQASSGGAETQRCVLNPCRDAGVSFALIELHAYYAELRSPALAVADELFGLADQLMKADRTARNTRELLSERQQENEMLSKMFLLKDAPWARCIDALSAIPMLSQQVTQLAEEVRRQAHSQQHLGFKPGQRGRPDQRLLRAVSQHLAHGGFDYSEIAVLIPDTNPGDEKGSQDERARKRADNNSTDCRTFVPVS